jgi:hypothetical protein
LPANPNESLTVDLAKFVKSVEFPPEDHARYEELSARASDGTLSPSECDLLNGYLHVDSLLTILRLKAERSLASSTR